MAVTLHLVRHGRTAGNRVKRVMGWSDEPIEDDQHLAAKRVAERLGRMVPPGTTVVSSPVHRARQTAAPTGERLGVEVQLDDRLGELHVGRWQGMLETEIAEQEPEAWTTWRTTPHTLRLEGRETLEALYGRVADFLDELASVERTVVGFTHDAVVRAAVAWAVGAGPESYRAVEVANCSLTTIEVREDGSRRLVRANDTCHVDHGSGW
ncbi:MAG TPA: histidine phosphatase family protein [Microthrixaceae bacterium]|nr:histidine phosphatase family protein [Microthrixaceae bacterium]